MQSAYHGRKFAVSEMTQCLYGSKKMTAVKKTDAMIRVPEEKTSANGEDGSSDK